MQLRVLITICLTLLTPTISFASPANSIQIKGSDTMVNLVQAWSEAFMEKHPEAYIAVTGGGSGTGIAALLSGTCDIAQSSRSIKKEEIAKAEANGIKPKEYIVAIDGLAVVVHANNPISKLTIDQVADIFTGKIKNWKELGGENRPVVILSREVNSGTHVYFKEHVLRKGNSKSKIEFAPQSLLMPSSQAIADEIAQNPNAIGYYGVGYVDHTQKALSIAKDSSSAYSYPTPQNIKSGEYYISRPLILYTNGEPKDEVKDFIEFSFTSVGQQIVKDTDFVPIK